MGSKGRSAGFTLIELLVVIAIIAILAGILFPVFVTAKQAAKRSACMNNMKQLGTAFIQYKNDWGGFYPFGGGKLVSTDMSLEWQNTVFRYVKSDSVFRCPGTPCLAPDPKKPLDIGGNVMKPRTPVTYLFNMGLGYSFNAADPFKSHHESEVLRQTKCAMLMEGNNGVSTSQHNGIDGHGRQKTMWLADYTFYRRSVYITGGDSDAKRYYGLPHHNDGGNVVFTDNHTKYVKYNSTGSLQATLPWTTYVRIDGGAGMTTADAASTTWQ